MASGSWRTRLVVVAALGLSTPAWASDRGEPTAATHIKALGSDIDALVALGIDRSPTFRELVAQVERRGGVVFVMRGRCPANQVVSCLLLDTAATVDGRLHRRVLIDNRRFRRSNLEIASIAHEFQHVLEAAEAGDVIDKTSLSAHFGRIGSANRLKTRRTMTYETEAARQVGERVLYELEHATPVKGATHSLGSPTDPLTRGA
jgi:hypothetical protein